MKDTTIKFRTSTDQLMRIKEVCEEIGVNNSAFIRYAIDELIKNYNERIQKKEQHSEESYC